MYTVSSEASRRGGSVVQVHVRQHQELRKEIMRRTEDIHTIAESFLRDLERGEKATFYASPEENPHVTTLADTITERVLVQREEAPPYLAGFKTSGRPVFTHDVKLAMSWETNSFKLVGVLRQMRDAAIPVETMPATWFSNHQQG